MHIENTLVSFASDNNAGVHPRILEALASANAGDAFGYGEDPWTEALQDCMRMHFGKDCQSFPVFLGTAANVLCLQAMARPWEAVLCADMSHINRDERGAPEAIVGCKLLPVPSRHGKLDPLELARHLPARDFVHRNQAAAVSVTQPTEMGTLYRLEELRAIGDFCREHGLWFHMDGARLANACAAMGVGMREMTREAGVDALSLGGTKNGLLCGEAVVVFREELAAALPAIRKQGMQLASKLRFLSVQLLTLFEGDLWLQNARHANAMAALLGSLAKDAPGVQLESPVETNVVFARADPQRLQQVRRQYPFYIWNGVDVARWMTAWNTREEDVRAFASVLAHTC